MVKHPRDCKHKMRPNNAEAFIAEKAQCDLQDQKRRPALETKMGMKAEDLQKGLE